MENLFSILERASLQNSTSFWREVFSQVMYPVLEDIQLAVESQQQIDKPTIEFYTNTLRRISSKFATFLNEFYLKLPNVVSVYIDIMCLFVANIRNSSMAQIVATSLVDLVQTIGTKLSTQEWDSFTSSLCLCFEETLPKPLLAESDPQNLQHLFTQCIVQLQLINCAKETLARHYSQFSESNIHQILASLEVSHTFAKRFNENVEVRKNLWKKGFMGDVDHLPGLIKQ